MAKAGRIPTIQEPADPVLRAIYRLRDTDLSPLEQTGFLVLSRLLHDGKREIGAALLAAVLRISVGSANNVLSTLRAHNLIGSDGKYVTKRSGRAARWLTMKGRRILGLRSAPREHKGAHRTMSKRCSSGREHDGDLCSSGAAPLCSPGAEPDSGSDKRRPAPPAGAGRAAAGKTKTAATGSKNTNNRPTSGEAFPSRPTVALADIMCTQDGERHSRRNGQARGVGS